MPTDESFPRGHQLPTVCRITIYPIKSLDGHDLAASRVLAGGALAEDRRYALVDSWERPVNGKRCPAIHAIRASYSENLRHVTLTSAGRERRFEIAAEQAALAAWCSEVLGAKCRLVENAETGFPDDRVSPGPTLVSTASLEAVTAWFPGLAVTEARRRFRFNLEVANAPAFWEDGLVPALQRMRLFRIGDLHWQGRGVCERCVVPTRDSRDGSVSPRFALDFARSREQSLPDWAAQDRFEHYYRLGVNTSIDSGEPVPSDQGPGEQELGNNVGIVRVGDQVELIG